MRKDKGIRDSLLSLVVLKFQFIIIISMFYTCSKNMSFTRFGNSGRKGGIVESIVKINRTATKL